MTSLAFDAVGGTDQWEHRTVNMVMLLLLQHTEGSFVALWQQDCFLFDASLRDDGVKTKKRYKPVTAAISLKLANHPVMEKSFIITIII